MIDESKPPASLETDLKIEAMIKRRYGAYYLLRSQAERDASNSYKQELRELVRAALSCQAKNDLLICKFKCNHCGLESDIVLPPLGETK